MITLALDASTYRGTVAVLERDRLVVQASTPMRGRDSENLMPTVDKALREAGGSLETVERIVCGGGPGSFTSLRIAASLAKGIAVGRSIPLFAVSSLALIVAGNVKDGPRGARRFLAALDALRGESYVAEFEHLGGAVRPLGGMRLLANAALQASAEATNARLVGPEQAEQWLPHARGVALMEDAIATSGSVNLAAWEPIYGRLAEAQVKWEATHGRPLQG